MLVDLLLESLELLAELLGLVLDLDNFLGQHLVVFNAVDSSDFGDIILNIR